MRNLILIAVFLSIFPALASAEIPIYCPHCKAHLYNYQKSIEEMKNPAVNDFLAVDANAMPVDDNLAYERWLCPYDGAPLNGWLFWAKKQNFKSFTMAYPVLSVLTKNEDGVWLWVPYAIPSEG